MMPIRRISPTVPRTLLCAGALVLAGPFAADAAPVVGSTSGGDDLVAPAGARPAAAAVKAERAVRGSRAFDVELDRYRGAIVWEVKVARRGGAQWELRISANGRRVLTRERDRTPDADGRLLRVARVSARRAIAIAQRRGGSRLAEIELDRTRGGVRWSAELRNPAGAEVEVAIDARTGRVLRIERDDS